MFAKLLRATFVLTLTAGGVAFADGNSRQTATPQSVVFNQGGYGVWNFAQASLNTTPIQVGDQEAVLASARFAPANATTPTAQAPRVMTINVGQARVRIVRNY